MRGKEIFSPIFENFGQRYKYHGYGIYLSCLYILYRAVARSEDLGGHIVMGGDNVPPLVEIGLTDLPKSGGARAPPAPLLRRAHSDLKCLITFGNWF